MGSIKSVGGLNRGIGFEELTSLMWLLSMPACGEVHKALKEEVVHKDLSQAIIKRDPKDLQTSLL